MFKVMYKRDDGRDDIELVVYYVNVECYFLVFLDNQWQWLHPDNTYPLSNE